MVSGLQSRNREDDSRRKELGSVAAMLDKVAYGRGRDMGEFLGRGNDYGLDFRGQPPVHVRNGPLRLEVEHVPHSTDDMPDTQLTAGIDGKVVVFDNPDSGQAADSLGYDVHPLVHREEPGLVLVDTDGHDDFVEHGQSPLEYIQVSCGEWIEGTWE